MLLGSMVNDVWASAEPPDAALLPEAALLPAAALVEALPAAAVVDAALPLPAEEISRMNTRPAVDDPQDVPLLPPLAPPLAPVFAPVVPVFAPVVPVFAPVVPVFAPVLPVPLAALGLAARTPVEALAAAVAVTVTVFTETDACGEMVHADQRGSFPWPGQVRTAQDSSVLAELLPFAGMAEAERERERRATRIALGYMVLKVTWKNDDRSGRRSESYDAS